MRTSTHLFGGFFIAHQLLKLGRVIMKKLWVSQGDWLCFDFFYTYKPKNKYCHPIEVSDELAQRIVAAEKEMFAIQRMMRVRESVTTVYGAYQPESSVQGSDLYEKFVELYDGNLPEGFFKAVNQKTEKRKIQKLRKAGFIL